MREISQGIVRMALDSSNWGYTRIQGLPANFGHKVGRGTVADVLNIGIEPSPERNKRTRRSTFLKAHKTAFAASDFLTAEVWIGRELMTRYLLFVISLAHQGVHVLWLTTGPKESRMLRIRRNLIDSESGTPRGR